MKVIIAALYLLILAFLGICEDKENECTEIDYDNIFALGWFECTIYSEIIDTENGENCNTHEIEFEKFHCGGTVSNLMSYGFNGCYLDGEITYLTNMNLGLYTVSFSYDEDYIDFRLKDDTGILHEYKIYGREIKYLTNFGRDAKGIVITFEIPNYTARVRPSAI
jgi:hypothetical protein